MQQNHYNTNRIIELPRSYDRNSRLSMDSSGSSRMRQAGLSIMGSVPKNKAQFSIPTGFSNAPSNQHQNQQNGFGQFEEEFCFGSP